MSKTDVGTDGKRRCSWCSASKEYIDYHDQEWGYPVNDDRQLFEKLCLESFQSGLSWRTILAKQDNFRKAFKQFDFNKVAKFGDQDVEKLLNNEGIVRHRGKIEATINNAKKAKELIKEKGSLAAHFWQFEPVRNSELTTVPSSTEESLALSKDLKKRGWKFVGPTTVYAFMQATGMVNDHAPYCIGYEKTEVARKQFKRPK